MSLLEKLSRQPLCADGGIAPVLLDLGLPPTPFPAELCLRQPEVVSEIHTRYRKAGAQILRTNSLNANPVRLAKLGLADHLNEINWQASQLAKQAGPGLEIAGRVGPLGLSDAEADSAGVDREECFRLQIGALLDGGATMIWLEGFSDLDELLLAFDVKQSLHHCPAICTLTMTAFARSTDFGSAFRRLLNNDVDVLGLDHGTVTDTVTLLEDLRKEGALNPHETPLAVTIASPTSPGEFAQAGRDLAATGVQILGGDERSAPAHIAALVKALAPDDAKTA